MPSNIDRTLDILGEEKNEPVEPGLASQSSAGAAVDAAEPVGSSRTPEHRLLTTLIIIKTLPKAQRTRGLSSTYQSNFFGSYHKFKHKS